MSKFGDLIKGLKGRIFASEEQEQAPDETASSKYDREPPVDSRSAEQLASDIPKDFSNARKTLKPKRPNPHFVQIGFDFGTAYSKCVCRDVMTDKAWVHIPSSPADQTLPFLIPTILIVEDDHLRYPSKPGTHYPDGGLYHLKLALEKVALQQWNDPVLDSYRRVSKEAGASQLASFVEASAIYFLAGALGDIRKTVQQRLAGFGEHPDDYMAVNLAVPVADAERPAVNALYHRVLCHSWTLADELVGHPPISFGQLQALLDSTRGNVSGAVRDACFIYPEVSANVQGFVRSRASSEGMYLFSDTGAGTVDQSVFIFNRQGHTEHLVYLHGCVLPSGSSCIERYAAEISGKGVDWAQLERLRQEKEGGRTSTALTQARIRIAKELDLGTTRTLALAREKLFRRDQIKDIRIIFGGGGHCHNPYQVGTLSPFSGNLFAQTINPDVVGLPTPKDLGLKPAETSWLSRLSVAYGLSFEKSELVRFTYPVNVQTPKPEELWRPRARQIEAATKDVC